MPNIKRKSCPYAVITSASFWLKQQESVWLLNMHTHPFKSAEFPSCLPFRAQPMKEGPASALAAALGAVRGAEQRLPSTGPGPSCACNCDLCLHLNDIKQTFQHICSRDTALKITVPWHKCADLKLTDVYSWITLGWLHAIATFCSDE